MEFFYNGILRFDIGFYNPNKTATLLIQLIYIILFFLEIKGSKNFLKIILFCLLLICIFFFLKTFSRGGIVAICCTILPYLYITRDNSKRSILYIVILGLSLLWAINIGVIERISNSVQDASVINRLEIWRNVPNMIFDAPNGWGFGNAGKAYMCWYQKLESTEKYRTLVNTHFTWLVEFGWAFRIIYIYLWSLILYITFPYKKQLSLIPFLVWLSFAISAFFSNVAESPYLWIIPIITLIYTVFFHIRHGIVYSLYPIILFLSMPLIFYSSLYFYKHVSCIHYKEFIQIGNGNIKLAIFVDPTVIGEYTYAKELRRIISERSNASVIVIYDDTSYPTGIEELENIILMGKIGPQYLSKFNTSSQNIFLINPFFTIDNMPNKMNYHVYIGEFSTKCNRLYWNDFDNKIEMQGVGDFCPNIWEYISTYKIFN